MLILILKGFLLFFLGMSTLAVILFFIYRSPEIELADLEPDFFTAESAYTQVGDSKIHYRLRGEGPVMLLIHGSFSSLHTWQMWEDGLSQDFTTLSVDLPGHGLTGPNEEGIYTSAYYAVLLWQLLDQLEIDTAILAGNSLGGRVAYEMALEHPERTQALILVNAAGAKRVVASDSIPRKTVATTSNNRSNRISIFKLLETPVVGSMITQLTPKFLFERNLQEVFYDSDKVTDQLVDRYYRLICRAGNRQATLDRLGQSSPLRFDELSSLEKPTLILWGKQDRWIPVYNANYFHAQLPSSELAIVDQLGHVPMEEDAARSLEPVIDFLMPLKGALSK
ncbi:MAG: alpha/beta hydrolase [Cyclobacteriaceae bacterium]|nr:alpha/beta hydrolase [Cyclobacteriaceae bacterium]